MVLAADPEAVSRAGATTEEDQQARQRIGQVVGGNYRVTRYIASGGSSHVFEVEHLRLGKSFAMKLLRPDFAGTTAARRFRREARAVATLNHEHVVAVVDCGNLENTTPYLVMELLDGRDLRSLLEQERRLPMRRAVHLLIEACRGVACVHAAGLIHRDLKPENLFVTRRAGGEDWCKILDFGVAKMESSFTTAQGVIVGTVRYMAPEQLSGEAALGPGVDIYALGAILYESLSGCRLFDGESVQEIMFRIMNREPIPLRELRPELPPALVATVMRAISKKPEDRPRTAIELEEQLSAVLSTSNEDASMVTLNDGSFHRPGRSKARDGVAIPWLWFAVAASAGTGVGLVLGMSSGRPAAHSASAPYACTTPPLTSGEPGVPRTRASAAEAQAISSVPTGAAASAANIDRPVRKDRPSGHGGNHRVESNGSSRPPVSVGTFDDSNPYGD